MECSFEVIYLYGGSGYRYCNYLYYDVYVVVGRVLFLFFLLEFINGVCGLRWMCCGGDVA